MKSLSVVFAGTPEFGLPALKALADSHHQLLAVYTQPDRPAGRGRKLQYSPIKDWALMQNIPVYQPLSFKEPTQVDELANLKPDVLVVIAYGLILPRKVLAIPRLGCVNVHASLLPRWRGASPIQHAILHGDKESGVTIMQMDAGMDTGDSLLALACPLSPKETAGSLHDKLAQLAVEPLLEVLDLLATERSQPVAQNNELATYAPKIQKEQALIDWSQPAMVIDRQIRAYNPWPICFSHFAGGESFRIHQAEIVSLTLEVNEPGKILQINKAGMLIAAGEQAINIKQLQFAGGKIISVADWINSKQHAAYIGQVLQ